MEMRLAVVDFQFVNRGIKGLTKCHYVVGALTPDLADRLPHMICKPPTENPSIALRVAKIKLTALSDRLRCIALIVIRVSFPPSS